MRYIVFSLLFSFCLGFVPQKTVVADSGTQSDVVDNLSSNSPTQRFYITAARLVQQQDDLMARIERAIAEPDPNLMRAVGGQLIVQTVAVESFLKRHYNSPKSLCSQLPSLSKVSLLPNQLSEPQAQIYCSLYASSQELFKLTPVLERLLSRRGELAEVRELPLVSGERQSHPILSISSVKRPELGKPATPFATVEPNLPTTAPQVIGRAAKTPLANYQPPVQPAIAPPPEALTILEVAKQLLAQAKTAFPPEIQFRDSRETAAVLERFAYDLDPQESQTYAKFLELPKTGIFRVLPSTAYLRELNTLQNRLEPKVNERYPFPTLKEGKGVFTPSLALQIVGENFQLMSSGVDYSFMVDLGDIPLEKLNGSLQAVAPKTREFFLNYQPPTELDALQVERRRFITGKAQNWNQRQTILNSAKVALNHTYLVRTLQFQLPPNILNSQPVSPQQRRYLDQLLEIHSSDIIVAFRPVRRRRDGSYTVLWRVLHQFQDPKIEDLEKYVNLLKKHG
jgi:hypothetical protein